MPRNITIARNIRLTFTLQPAVALISTSYAVSLPNRNRNPDRKSISAWTIISSTRKATSAIRYRGHQMR